MNYRKSPLLSAERAAHIAECRARRAPPCTRAAESLAEYERRGGRIERLPMNAVSPVNQFKRIGRVG